MKNQQKQHQKKRPDAPKKAPENRDYDFWGWSDFGFLGMMVSPDYGGGGMDTQCYVHAMEEICKIDASTGVILSVNNSLVCWGLEHFGTEEQKQKYLIPLATGEKIGTPGEGYSIVQFFERAGGQSLPARCE